MAIMTLKLNKCTLVGMTVEIFTQIILQKSGISRTFTMVTHPMMI